MSLPAYDLLRRYLPILAWGAEYTRQTLAQRPDRGGDRHGHADPAVAGLCAAGRAAAGGRAVRLDGAARALRGLRHLARARGRPRGGGQPHDRGSAGAAGGPGNAGVPRGRHRARAGLGAAAASRWGCCGWDSSRTSSATRSSRASSRPRASRSRPASSRPCSASSAEGETFVDLAASHWCHLGQINPYTAAIGLASLAFLFWVRRGLKPLLRRLGLGERPADILAKLGPAVAIVATTAGGLGPRRSPTAASAIVGTVPKGLPALALPPLDRALVEAPRPRTADLHRGLRGVHLRRPDARRQAPPARRPRSGADRARRRERRRGRLGRLPRSPAASRARW